MTQFLPPEGAVDIVTFSYSLTMIPDWFAAREQADKILKPVRIVGVVDFYVSRKHPPDGWQKHSFFDRTGQFGLPVTMFFSLPIGFIFSITTFKLSLLRKIWPKFLSYPDLKFRVYTFIGQK